MAKYRPPAPASADADKRLTLTIPQRAQVLQYARNCAERFHEAMPNFRGMMEFRDRAYIRQLNVTAKQLEAVRKGMAGEPTMAQDLTVPIIMPQIESSVAYKAGVFLSNPGVFGVVAPPEFMDAALKFETTLMKQAEKFGWSRSLIRIFRNADKYNFGPAIVDWKRVPVRQIQEGDIANATTRGQTQIKHGTYEGNQIKAVDPYNCFYDPMVLPGDMHQDGEFFGETELMTRIAFKRLVAGLDPRKTTQLKEAYESSYAGDAGTSTGAFDYHVPSINRYFSMDARARAGTTNWGSWSGLEKSGNNDINYRDKYLVTTMYCRACPSDFNGKGNLPAVYKFIIVNWQIVIYAELIESAHDYLPCLIMTPQDDGLGSQTPSKLDNSIPYQDMASGMWNMTMESSRRRVFDRIVYNAHHIDKKDIDPAAAVSRIPVRNAAMMNFDINRALHKIPYEDSAPTLGIQASQYISQMADEAAGQNRVSRGQFQKGNKTTTEFETTQDNSNARQQLEAVVVEQQFMVPCKEIIKSNTLQNQAVESIYNQDKDKVVEIDPTELRKAILAFDLTDGVLPADKLMNPQVMQVFMQTAQALPTLTTEYDVLGMFLYWCKLKGAKWLESFKLDAQGQQGAMERLRSVSAAQNATPTDGAQQQALQAQATAAAQPAQGAAQ